MLSAVYADAVALPMSRRYPVLLLRPQSRRDRVETDAMSGHADHQSPSQPEQ
jgi:hypothetical protein